MLRLGGQLVVRFQVEVDEMVLLSRGQGQELLLSRELVSSQL